MLGATLSQLKRKWANELVDRPKQRESYGPVGLRCYGAQVALGGKVFPRRSMPTVQGGTSHDIVLLAMKPFRNIR